MIGEGEYNLDYLKEIIATESYLGFDKTVRKCQDVEDFNDCTTRHYLGNILSNCGCLPLNMRLSNKVYYAEKISKYNIIITRYNINLGTSLLVEEIKVCGNCECK